MSTLVGADPLDWMQTLPVSDKFTAAAPAPVVRPELPVIEGWTLFLFPDGNLWKITGRRGSIAVNVGRLSADQVRGFKP